VAEFGRGLWFAATLNEAGTMRRIISAIGTAALAGSVLPQTTCNLDAIEKQQRVLSRQVTVLQTNFSTSWNSMYPRGAPFETRDKSKERAVAWQPKFEPSKDFFALNDGIGCVVFVATKPGATPMPDICASADVRAQMAMETLREDWDNSRNIAPGESPALSAMRVSVAMLWAEEKALYCVLPRGSVHSSQQHLRKLHRQTVRNYSRFSFRPRPDGGNCSVPLLMLFRWLVESAPYSRCRDGFFENLLRRGLSCPVAAAFIRHGQVKFSSTAAW
jgi:hypothetical protein